MIFLRWEIFFTFLVENILGLLDAMQVKYFLSKSIIILHEIGTTCKNDLHESNSQPSLISNLPYYHLQNPFENEMKNDYLNNLMTTISDECDY